MITEIRKNMNLFVDGIGFAGKVEEINPPEAGCQNGGVSSRGNGCAC